MQFTLPRLQELLKQPGTNVSRQAKLDNLACEERVCEARLTTYQSFLRNELHSDSGFDDGRDSWAALHERYFRQWVAVKDSATFLESSEWTARPSIAEEDWIIRVERVDGAFSKWELGASTTKSAVQWLSEWAQTLNAPPAPTPTPSSHSLADLGALLGHPAKPVPAPTIMELFDYWNGTVRLDHRPSFVAFKAELKDDLDAPDWAERLCIRLGLGHCFFGSEVTLALMRYQVGDVLDTCKGQIGFCAPTALDGGFFEYFHPSPRGCDWGFAAILDVTARDDSLVAELLHRRIDYHPEHLWRVGTVNRSRIADADLLPMRNAHVGRLRRQSGRGDFGILR